MRAGTDHAVSALETSSDNNGRNHAYQLITSDVVKIESSLSNS